MTAAVRDVTQQRQARDDLTQTNQNLQSFSYSLAHDLRTPLRGISGFAEVLAEDYGDRLDETGRQYARRVQAGCVSEFSESVNIIALYWLRLNQPPPDPQP